MVTSLIEYRGTGSVAIVVTGGSGETLRLLSNSRTYTPIAPPRCAIGAFGHPAETATPAELKALSEGIHLDECWNWTDVRHRSIVIDVMV